MSIENAGVRAAATTVSGLEQGFRSGSQTRELYSEFDKCAPDVAKIGQVRLL
jgi:plasmid stabilization system protein ParE